MRKSNNSSGKRNTPSQGPRRANMPANQHKTSQDKRAESMNLGNILTTSASRRKRRQRNQTILTVISLIVVSAIAFLIYSGIRDGIGNPSDAGSSAASQSMASSGLLSQGDSSIVESSNSAVVTIDPVVRANAFALLESEINSYITDFEGRIGIYYINLENGETFESGAQNPFVAASSIKMSIVTQLFKQITAGNIDLTEMLTYDNRAYPEGDMEYGTGIIINEPNGTQFSVQRTAQLCITVSDNCATNMIIRKLGGIDEVTALSSEISAVVPYRTPVTYTNYKGATVTGKHRISAKDLAMYAKILYELWSADPQGYGLLMDDLQNTVFDFGIQSKLPETVPVAHKIGTNFDYRTENDVGIVFASEDYVLCVTTENESQDAGRAAVADISLMIYEYIENLYK